MKTRIFYILQSSYHLHFVIGKLTQPCLVSHPKKSGKENFTLPDLSKEEKVPYVQTFFFCLYLTCLLENRESCITAGQNDPSGLLVALR